MSSQILSQTISIKNNRVNAVVVNGDTLIQFKLSDAKIILADVLEKEKLENLVKCYEVNDSLKDVTVGFQYAMIRDLQSKCDMQLKVVDNLNVIIINKDKEIALLNDTIKKQKKEIRKQKALKIMGFTAAIVAPIIVLIYK
jgi:uncharacterized coiled-coil protein SlyX